MSLWRKRKTSDTNRDTIEPNVHYNGQNQPKWFNMTALANNDLSIKSDDLSIKSEKAMREVQRLGQEIEQEPVAWYRDENGIRIYYETKVWDDCTPLYTTPQQPTWTGLTDEDAEIKRLNEKIEFLARTNMLYSDWEHRETQVTSDLIRKGIEEAKINAELRAEIEHLKEVSWGVDWGKAGDTPCATIVRRLLNGGIEVLAVEYAPYTLKEKNT